MDLKKAHKYGVVKRSSTRFIIIGDNEPLLYFVRYLHKFYIINLKHDSYWTTVPAAYVWVREVDDEEKLRLSEFMIKYGLPTNV